MVCLTYTILNLLYKSLSLCLFICWQEENDFKTKQWSSARLTRSATLPRKSRTIAGSSACSVGGGGSICHANKTPKVKKSMYPSSGSSGYNSLPRMNGGRKSGGGSSSIKNSPSSELSYKMQIGGGNKPETDACRPDTVIGGQGSNFDSSYSCDEISVHNSSIALVVPPPPPATATKSSKTAADLRREYFRGLSKYGPTVNAGGSYGSVKDQQQRQQNCHQYFNRNGSVGGSAREKKAISASLHKYFDNACKIK